MRKWAAAIAVVLALGMAGGAEAEKDKYIPRGAKLNAFRAAWELGTIALFGTDAYTVSVEGRWTRAACKGLKRGTFRCPMAVYYRMELGNGRDRCSAPLVVWRTGYRFPLRLTTCPYGWIPPPKRVVWPDKSR